MKTYVVSALALVAVAFPALAQDTIGDRVKTATKVWNTVELMSSVVPDFSFQEQPLDSIFDAIQREFPGLTIIVRWTQLGGYGIERDKTITVNIKNFRLDQVLWLVMNEAAGGEVRLAYRASGNQILISTAEDLGKETIVKVYDVTDLIVRVPRFRDAPEIDIQQAGQGGGQGGATNLFGGQGGGGGQDDEDNQQQDQAGQVDPEMQILINLITSTIEPTTWQVNGGAGTISAFRRQIVVNNNILVHQKLGGAIEEGTGK